MKEADSKVYEKLGLSAKALEHGEFPTFLTIIAGLRGDYENRVKQAESNAMDVDRALRYTYAVTPPKGQIVLKMASIRNWKVMDAAEEDLRKCQTMIEKLKKLHSELKEVIVRGA